MQGSPGSISADVKQFSKHEMLETDWGTFTHRNISGIILNHTEVGLYLPISDWFGTGKERPFAVSNNSENGICNLISV